MILYLLIQEKSKMSQVERKIKFIRKWYRQECQNLEFKYRLKLARLWVDICIRDEEYEMAAAIKEERQEIVRLHIKEKRKSRRLSQKIMIFIFLFKRRFNSWIGGFKNWIKSKL